MDEKSKAYKYEEMVSEMDCGHFYRYAVYGDDGGDECILCEAIALRAENERLRDRIADYEYQYRSVLSEECADDEQHCSCVPVLRQRIAELQGQIENDLPLAQACERIAELEAAQRWISVEERLPEKRGYYFVSRTCARMNGQPIKKTEILFYGQRGIHRWESNDPEVTHWRYLPEPPSDNT